MTKLTLVKGEWQEIGAFSFTGQKKPAAAVFEITTASALPTGDVDASMIIDRGEPLYFPADASGDSFYVRCLTDDSASYIVTEN